MLYFYDKDWTFFGVIDRWSCSLMARELKGVRTKTRYVNVIDVSVDVAKLTEIPFTYLVGQSELSEASIAQKMSWAARRKTTRIEDEAYSLLGIFGVNMPLIYGERHRAFLRLQEEILRRSTDMSIFAIDSDNPSNPLLGGSPWTFGDQATSLYYQR